jgi:hypothetical protein
MSTLIFNYYLRLKNWINYNNEKIKKKIVINNFKYLLIIPSRKNIELTPLKKNCTNTIIKKLFFNENINYIPHTQIGLIHGNMLELILINIKTQYQIISNYKFIDELDYISILENCNYTMFTRLNNKSGLDIFYDLIENKIGYSLINYINNEYIIDTTELSKYEIRDGYTNLNFIIYLDIINDIFVISKIKNNNKIYYEYSENFDLIVREATSAIITLLTLKEHLFKLHLLVSDKFNMLLENNLSENNQVSKLLYRYRINPYEINEIASLTLFSNNGISLSFNLTQNSVVNYYNDTVANFNFRDIIDIDKLKSYPKKNINNEMILWWDCIFNFVSLYLNDIDENDIELNMFLNILNKEYPNILLCKSMKQNIIDICSLILFSPIIHELYSNPELTKIISNPFIISTSWKNNNSTDLIDKINNLSEQLNLNLIAYRTSYDSLNYNDKKLIEETDKKNIVTDFYNNINKLPININSIIHPTKISSSICV